MKQLNYNEAKERAYMGQFNNVSMLVEHVSKYLPKPTKKEEKEKGRREKDNESNSSWLIE